MLAVSPTPRDKFAVYVDRAANAAGCLSPNIGYIRAVVEQLAGVLATRHGRIDRQRWLVELEEVLSALDDSARAFDYLRVEINALRELHASLPRSALAATARSTDAVQQRASRRTTRKRRA
jgi:hypothetical protein